eukprot:COSAG01_NODE_4756_length_4763_cov_4.080617_3_plen_237_part_00
MALFLTATWLVGCLSLYCRMMTKGPRPLTMKLGFATPGTTAAALAATVKAGATKQHISASSTLAAAQVSPQQVASSTSQPPSLPHKQLNSQQEQSQKQQVEEEQEKQEKQEKQQKKEEGGASGLASSDLVSLASTGTVLPSSTASAPATHSLSLPRPRTGGADSNAEPSHGAQAQLSPRVDGPTDGVSSRAGGWVWTPSNMQRLQQLVAQSGEGDWEAKAIQLGTSSQPRHSARCR